MLIPANNYGTYAAEVREILFPIGSKGGRLIRVLTAIQKQCNEERALRVIMTLSKGPTLLGCNFYTRDGRKLPVVLFASSLE